MKKFYKLKLVLIVVLMGNMLNTAIGQQWKKNLPAQKSSYTLFDYQKAFNDYWTPFNVVEGKYINENGVSVKAPGWKQFKRWEFYWRPRVNNETGEFPTTTAWDVWQDYVKQYPVTKSQLGTWQSLGPANLDAFDLGAMQESGTGRLNCMIFDPADNNHFWVGAPAGGVWESLDAGNSWTCLTDNNLILGISDIAIPSNYNKLTNSTIYIGTGDRDAYDDPSIGILKSTDGGLTWNKTGLSFNSNENGQVGRIICSPSDPNTLIAATFSGMFKSVDAGATWSMMQSGKFIDMELIPTTSTLIATTVGWGPKAYRSTDFGQTWTLVYQGNVVEEYRCDVAVTPASTSTVYIITDWGNSLDALYGIFKSTDAGNSFTKVYDGAVSNNLYGWNATNTENDGGQGWYDVAFAVSNTNANVVYVGGVNGYVSLDGALTFDVCNGWSSYVGADVVHADHHNAYFRPSDNRLFDVNDGGVYYSDNVTLGKTSSWISITDGIVTGQIYDIGVSQATVGTIVAGFQDNGTKLLTPASTDWKIVKSGDGMECAIDTKNTAIQWGTYVELQVSQTTNTWGSSTSLRNSGTAQWAGPLESDPNGGGYVYIGTSGVEVYPNTTIPVKSTVIDEKAPAKFVSLSGTLDGTNFLNTLDIYNDGVNRVIWAASPAGCWKSPGTTGAGTYIKFANLPANLVTDIAIDDNNYNHVYLCFGGYDNINVWETLDGGTTWTDISEGLPAVPASTLAINEQNTSTNEVYIGTDAGIFVKLGTAPWQLYSNGMPFVSITDLEFYYDKVNSANTMLYTSTYGRGVWKGDCYDAPSLDASISSIIQPEAEYCEPGSFIPTFNLANIGTTTLTSATVTYSIDGGTPVVQNWTGSLAQGATIAYTFPQVSLTLGTHTITATVSNANGAGTDQNIVNDTKTLEYSLWNHEMPYTQNFDAFANGGNFNNYDGSTIALSECWVNEAGDNMDWSVTTGESPSANTGPSGDHTTGTGTYIYTETSNGNINKTALLSSPDIDLSAYTGTQVTFWYHMYGSTMGSLSIDLYYNGINHTSVPVYWQSLGITATIISGTQPEQWFQATVDVSAADGASDFKFTFHAVTGTDAYGDMAIDDFTVTGTQGSACTPPTIQASNFSSTPSLNTISTSWLRGNGDKVLVVARQGSAVNADPISGTTYTANSTFGSGTQIGTGNYVVYNGLSTSSAVTVSGLALGTTYYFAVYEYNSVDNCYNTMELTGNSTTFNIPTLTTNSASAITTTSATSGGNVTSINGSILTAKGVCWNTTGNPTTLNSKTNDIAQGTGTGSFTSSITGLTSATIYYVKSYATNAAGTAYGNEISFTTLSEGISCTYPTIQASAFVSAKTSTSITASWTRGNGNNVIVVMKQGAAVSSNPVDGISYTASTVFGSGTQIGTGNYVVYNGPATSVTVTGLTAGTLYYFAIYEYNSTGLCYKIPALTASATTSFGGRTIIDSDKATIYPNPNRGTFNINVNYEYTDYKVELRTITGQVIYANKFENLGTKEIILNNATPGIYFLKIYFNDNTSADYKVIIQ